MPGEQGFANWQDFDLHRWRKTGATRRHKDGVSVRTIQTWLGHDDNFFIHSGALRQLTAQLTALRGSLMDVARFKQLTGLSRKYAIPLLEYLDRQRITRIQGDQRLVL